MSLCAKNSLISERCELMKFYHINCSGPVFFETYCIYSSRPKNARADAHLTTSNMTLSRTYHPPTWCFQCWRISRLLSPLSQEYIVQAYSALRSAYVTRVGNFVCPQCTWAVAYFIPPDRPVTWVFVKKTAKIFEAQDFSPGAVH